MNDATVQAQVTEVVGKGVLIRSPEDKPVICWSQDVFSLIDPRFFGLMDTNLDVDLRMEKIPFRVQSIIAEVSLEELFASFGQQFDELCFDQRSIYGFVRRHQNWLRRDRHSTYFLFKNGKSFYVAGVQIDVDLGEGVDQFPSIYARCLHHKQKLHKGFMHRVVVPDKEPWRE